MYLLDSYPVPPHTSLCCQPMTITWQAWRTSFLPSQWQFQWLLFWECTWGGGDHQILKHAGPVTLWLFGLNRGMQIFQAGVECYKRLLSNSSISKNLQLKDICSCIWRVRESVCLCEQKLRSCNLFVFSDLHQFRIAHWGPFLLWSTNSRFLIFYSWVLPPPKETQFYLNSP